MESVITCPWTFHSLINQSILTGLLFFLYFLLFNIKYFAFLSFLHIPLIQGRWETHGIALDPVYSLDLGSVKPRRDQPIPNKAQMCYQEKILFFRATEFQHFFHCCQIITTIADALRFPFFSFPSIFNATILFHYSPGLVL